MIDVSPLSYQETVKESGVFLCKSGKSLQSFISTVKYASCKTIALYDRQLEYLAAYMENVTGLTNIEEVRSIHIKKFLVGKADAGRKPQYINDLLKAYKVFFKYCLQEGHTQTDPCAKVQNVKQPKVKIRTFNEEEIRKMLNYYSGRKFTDIRNKTMLAMFFDTGMRLNEVLTLKQEQIHDPCFFSLGYDGFYSKRRRSGLCADNGRHGAFLGNNLGKIKAKCSLKEIDF